jgi:5-methylcytosine-specific restriction endonuclease McrA
MKSWVGQQCHYCDAPAEGNDHIVPRALLKKIGAVDMPYNIVPACNPCNVAKAHSLPTCRCKTCRAALDAFKEIGEEILFLATQRAQRAKQMTFNLGEVFGAELLGRLDTGTAEP